MLTTYRMALATLLRTPSALIWSLAFPVIMATVFMLMFSGMRTDGVADPVAVAVVADDAWESAAFSVTVESLAEGEEPLLDVRETTSEQEARGLVEAGAVDGAYLAGADGEPRLVVADAAAAADQTEHEVNVLILEAVASSYSQMRGLLGAVASERPDVRADPDALHRALSLDAPLQRISLTHTVPDETVRYYYALLGMAALFSAQLAMLAVAGTRPTASASAARRCVSGTPRARQAAGALLASWTLSFLFLLVALAYLRLVVGIDFAGREPLCVAGVAAASAMAAGMGALVGSLPLHGGANAGSGLLTGATCILSLFAGLYGQPAMELADAVARSVPVLSWINPVKLVCDLFYSLYFYESLVPFALRAAACVAWAAVLLAAASPLMRRQRYAHL